MPPQAPLRASRILLAGVIGSGLGAAVALMLYAVVTNTPAEVSPRTFALYFAIFCAFGAVAGLTLETVRQLQARNPDPAYHRYPRQQAHRQSPQRHRPAGEESKGD